ncbi:hypothetical protein Cni_G02267 [Canna indica]|uniref:Translation initiation factor 3 N-terminal domain-containing protein n=1 Tax=Canna indica TaxID=4628 RepID=A0AAQ3JPT2_9LILI|nr:hypothetical protein Cni_G02267 [Canna indica]
MARTEQTVRKSTGGKAPRKQLATKASAIGRIEWIRTQLQHSIVNPSSSPLRSSFALNGGRTNILINIFSYLHLMLLEYLLDHLSDFYQPSFRSSSVRLLDVEQNMLGVVSVGEAIQMADNADLILVQKAFSFQL